MTKDDRTTKGVNTRLAHIGPNPRDFHGFVNPPVVHASTVLFPDAKTMETRAQKYTYGTRGTPTSDALTQAFDELEGSAGTVLVPSGLMAVVLPLLGFTKAGDHVLITDSVYHPTRAFADQMLSRYGIEVEYYDPRIGGGIARLMRENTSVVFTESPASNTFEIQDIPAIAKVAHEGGAVVMMDNTWATPLFFKALDFGVDVSIHAATKYPAGHSDVLLGAVSANEKHWPTLRHAYLLTGAPVGPDDAYQVLRGLRTMGIRLERHQKTALEVARWLEGRPGIARVLHPALEGFPDNALFRRDYSGSSGIFSIVLDGGGKEKAHAFLDALEIFGLGYSWGGYESLALQVSIADRTVGERDYAGPIIRLQIGLEDVDDIKRDLEKALAAAAQES
jgi:cystathionine beta-lyase